ncbi:hypothetical protein PshuTeo1_15190 [Pseudomonas hunanensis]|nr:hypothetical protein PshuTeo1_15190 [Pseudomonas hunanensis]
MKDISKMLPPDHPLYTEVVEALKQYHEAQAAGMPSAELERLRLIAGHRFQAVTDYQLIAAGGSSGPSLGQPVHYATASLPDVTEALRLPAAPENGRRK